MLGKSDRHVARVAEVPRGPTGHNRFDVAWTLKDRPDIIASFGPRELAGRSGQRHIGARLLGRVGPQPGFRARVSPTCNPAHVPARTWRAVRARAFARGRPPGRVAPAVGAITVTTTSRPASMVASAVAFLTQLSRALGYRLALAAGIAVALALAEGTGLLLLVPCCRRSA